VFDVQRRALLTLPAAPLLLAGCGNAPVQGFADMGSARTAIQGLNSTSRFSGAWALPQVLHHLAQSIEYSVLGFPQPKSALFQHTAGRAAFAFFESRGAMSHSLQEPIPGAPTLAGVAAAGLDAARTRLLVALATFEAHTGPLAPHFAYGALDKNQYTRAHLMHLAHHWTELVRS
jgi:hypothetical protein